MSDIYVASNVDIVTTQEYGIDANSDGQLQLAMARLPPRPSATDPEPLAR